MSAVAHTSGHDLVDQALGGKLVQILTDLRAAEMPYDQMAQHFSDLGVKVSRETLRRWVKQMGIEAKAPAA